MDWFGNAVSSAVGSNQEKINGICLRERNGQEPMLIKKIKKYICRNLYYHFARKMPASEGKWGNSYKKIRYALASRSLEKCGRNVNFEHGARFDSDVSIGDNSGIGINCLVTGAAVIGNDVMMGPECIFYSRNHAHDRIDIPMNRQGFEQERPVTVGDDVWFGARVIVLPGVHIGSHCIIGAGAVVTKDVPDYAIVGGNPARILRMRMAEKG